MATKKKAVTEVVQGSGNVFADLGLANPDQELMKARLTLQIARIIRDRGLTQTEAAKILGIQQPHVSALARNSRRQLLGGPADGVSNGAWPGR